MALVTYPLNNIEYSAEDAELFHVTRTSGIYANNSFDYGITGADNNIVIGTGIGWIKNSEFSGKVIAQKEAISLDMGLPDPVYPRIDAIVIQFDNNRNETNIVIKKGTAASNPVAPSVVQNESVYELHLYHVRREAGSLYITPINITDLRLNSSYCGLMADSVTNIDTTAIERQVADLIESLQNEISNVIDGSAYLLRDGSTNMTGNLPMDGHKVTGLGTPTADGDAVPLGYANQNFAPDDYGLGKSQGFVITSGGDCNYARDNGWYYVIGAPNAASPYDHVMFVASYGPNAVHQIAFLGNAVSSNVYIKIRKCYGDAWTDWAYVNPHMDANTEYLTIERRNSAPVYKKLDSKGVVLYREGTGGTWKPQDTVKVKLWENAKISDAFNAQMLSLDLSEYDGVEILYYVDSTTGVYRSTGYTKVGVNGIMCYTTAEMGYRLHRGFSVSSTGIGFATATASSSVNVGTLCKPYQIFGIKGVK